MSDAFFPGFFAALYLRFGSLDRRPLHRFRAEILRPVLLFLSLPNCVLGVAVTTHHNDIYRSGANLSESLLTVANVNKDRFGKLFVLPVDDDVYAQPLYVPDVDIPDRGRHNVLYVVTQNDSVYAFDAENPTSVTAGPLWRVRLTRRPDIAPVPADDLGNPVLGNLRSAGQVGIMSTPVIDLVSRTLYLLARTKEGTSYVQRLHALDITNGAEKFGGPVLIDPAIAGQGAGSVAGTVRFLPREQNQRAGLALGTGAVYIAWASHNDVGEYHGWILACDAQTLAPLGVFNVTPDGRAGGIWQSGQPPALDASGNLYVATGNGSFSAGSGGRDYGQSVVRLAPRTLKVLDWFTPADWQDLNNRDLDINSAGPLLLPGEQRLIAGGKAGKLYLLNARNLGRQAPDNQQIVQSFQATNGGHMHGGAVHYASPSLGRLVYIWGEEDYLKAFRFNGSVLDAFPLMQNATPAPDGMPGGILSLSANGAQPGTGILWAALPEHGDANTEIVAGILRAYDANNLGVELWNSAQFPDRDALGSLAKFVPPTVAAGRVYLATFSKQIAVYGLLDLSAYAKIKYPRLQIVKAGSGIGRVSSEPSGISCGARCRIRFRAGTVVTLLAKPRAPARFRGWQGACPYRGKVCRFRLVGERQVTARFE